MAHPKTELMKRKAPVFFTPELKEKFLDNYRMCGLLYRACELTGVSSTTVLDHCKIDPVFGELYKEAKEAHTDSMIQAAIERAVEGVEEPIVGGQFRDEIVTTVRRYSDKLMELMLRSRRDEFRSNPQGDTGQAASGIIVLPARPTTAADWEAEFGEKARGQTGRPEGE